MSQPVDSCSSHLPVMVEEVIRYLNIQPGQTIVDGTLGGGGHSRALAHLVGNHGRVIGLDRDPSAIARAEQQLTGLPVLVAQASYCELPEILDEIKCQGVDGVLLDLGFSSDQLDDPDRGFSFLSDGPLDLRFDPTSGKPAWQLINKLSENQIADLIYEFGEERFSRRIARRIVAQRKSQPLHTARELAELVRSCVPRSKKSTIDAATRTFQALRIFVNDELGRLEKALRILPQCLLPGGTLAIISFHSLEDRKVKRAFREHAQLEIVTKKPIVPTTAEQETNPRSRSAKLRVARRNADDDNGVQGSTL
ncbi:MAG: 16S rRNA (cytosine(1402)-N(4))-methyltransferase RsmH [Planctomycetota bacterium]|nr:16S rRNA (cytosine(1402)-N(4))-methyltransferase RsmH [Planctomycetota bacterium]